MNAWFDESQNQYVMFSILCNKRKLNNYKIIYNGFLKNWNNGTVGHKHLHPVYTVAG